MSEIPNRNNVTKLRIKQPILCSDERMAYYRRKLGLLSPWYVKKDKYTGECYFYNPTCGTRTNNIEECVSSPALCPIMGGKRTLKKRKANKRKRRTQKRL
jgi:hypothetical protein